MRKIHVIWITEDANMIVLSKVHHICASVKMDTNCKMMERRVQVFVYFLCKFASEISISACTNPSLSFHSSILETEKYKTAQECANLS